jgi:hypothetical protein
LNPYGAIWVKLTLTRSQENIFAMSLLWCLTSAVGDRRHDSLLRTTGYILRNSCQHAADFLS